MIKFKLLVLVACFSLCLQLNAHNENIINIQKQPKGLVIKKFQAWSKYRDADYTDAIRRYTELNQMRPNDAFYNYMLGKCYLAINKYNEAISYFEAALRIDSRIKRDLPMQAGFAYHKKGDLDNALRHYNIYITSLSPRQLQRDELIMDYINSIMMARKLKAHPVNVKVRKLGANINSDYDDASPSISSDGKTLYFTSRRYIDGFEAINVENPYNDKMYMSQWDESTQSWGKAEPAANELNNIGHIGSLSLSHDSRIMFIYKNIPGKTQSGDIYFSQLQNDGRWTTPVDIGKPINTSYFESSAAISPDGNMLYFVSERKGGYGNADIYRSQRLSANKWGIPENLKAVINSPYDELGLFLHPDGKTLYFTSSGHRTMGGYDVFKSTLEDGVWTQPVNLGYPINTEFDEKHFVLAPDGKTAYISSNRDGVFDIYEIDMSNYSIKKPIERVVEYVYETGKTSPKYVTEKADSKDKENIDIKVYNTRNNDLLATFNSESQGEYALKLKSNDTYSINFINNDNKKTLANINTYESGSYVVKIGHTEFVINVDKTWRHSLVTIRMTE